SEPGHRAPARGPAGGRAWGALSYRTGASSHCAVGGGCRRARGVGFTRARRPSERGGGVVRPRVGPRVLGRGLRLRRTPLDPVHRDGVEPQRRAGRVHVQLQRMALRPVVALVLPHRQLPGDDNLVTLLQGLGTVLPELLPGGAADEHGARVFPLPGDVLLALGELQGQRAGRTAGGGVSVLGPAPESCGLPLDLRQAHAASPSLLMSLPWSSRTTTSRHTTHTGAL